MSKSMEELFAEFDAIQADRAANVELLEELDNGSSKDAEIRQDMIDGWDKAESEIGCEMVKLLRPLVERDSSGDYGYPLPPGTVYEPVVQSFGNVGPAVAQAAEMRRLGYDAFATADGRITAHLTVAQSIFVQGVTAVANTREDRKG